MGVCIYCIWILLGLLELCKGAIHCYCTTGECEASRDMLCTTASLCYVQYIPHAPNDDPHVSQIVRGCIDGMTPLLCENQRPGVYHGPWPVLFCCATDFCNKDVVPTLPAWASQYEDSMLNETGPEIYSNVNHDREISLPTLDSSQENLNDSAISINKRREPQNELRTKPRKYVINPLYVGVPVAGACVLLAIIIFAVYILRKQHRMYEDQYTRAQRLNLLKRQLPSYQSYQDGCHYITMTASNGQTLYACSGCMYSESDRSSNSSELRLIAQL